MSWLQDLAWIDLFEPKGPQMTRRPREKLKVETIHLPLAVQHLHNAEPTIHESLRISVRPNQDALLQAQWELPSIALSWFDFVYRSNLKAEA